MTDAHGIKGEYFEPLSSKSHKARLTLRGRKADVKLADGTVVHDLAVESQTGIEAIHFRDGSLFRASDPLTKAERETMHSGPQKLMAWFEHFTWPKAILLIFIFVLTIMMIRVLLIGGTDIAAQTVPHSWEHRIGTAYYDVLKRTALDPSRLAIDRRERLSSKARTMAQQAGLSPIPDIHFHYSGKLGANAIALPGGPVVVTDDLVKLLENDDEILAIIAHEFGHVRDRHSLRQMVSILGTSLVMTFIFGTDDSLMEEVTGLAVAGWAFSNSRGFERDADSAAVEILLASGRNPQAMVSAMEKLTLYGCKMTTRSDLEACTENSSTNWLSTHPSGKERLDNLKAQIRNSL